VIGPVTRDGFRQSRLIEFDENGFALSTFDHTTGTRTVDVRHDYARGHWERVGPTVEADESEHFAPPPMPLDSPWSIGDSVFAVNRGMLVEYDRAHAAPLGVVCELASGEQVRIRDEAIVVNAPTGPATYKRNATGRFGQIYTPNPYLNKRRSA
jgi:hypothetical protein